jgi:hypothetical protein
LHAASFAGIQNFGSQVTGVLSNDPNADDPVVPGLLAAALVLGVVLFAVINLVAQWMMR